MKAAKHFRGRRLPRRFLSSGCDDHSDDDEPCDHKANARAYAEGIEHREQEYEEERSPPQSRHISLATAHRGSADDYQSDRGEQIFVADLQRRTPEIACQECSADAAKRAAQNIGYESDPLHRNSGDTSSDGVVELTLALHKVFTTPKDKFVWDVSHQVYVHKILTGRKNRFRTIRQTRTRSTI